jgi:hypothetical protein
MRQISEAGSGFAASLRLGSKEKKEYRCCAMQAIGCAKWYVIARANNVVVVDFRRPDPPAPQFPGAGALRAAALEEDKAAGSWSFEDHPLRRQLLA